MKKHYSIHSIFVLAVLLLINSPVKGQANFSGGKGGGYEFLEVKTSTVGIVNEAEPPLEVTIFPNPIAKDQVLRVKINGLEKKSNVKIVVSNMIGYQVFVQEVEFNSEFEIELPFERLSKGIYLISIQHRKNKITRRLSYLG